MHTVVINCRWHDCHTPSLPLSLSLCSRKVKAIFLYFTESRACVLANNYTTHSATRVPCTNLKIGPYSRDLEEKSCPCVQVQVQGRVGERWFCVSPGEKKSVFHNIPDRRKLCLFFSCVLFLTHLYCLVRFIWGDFCFFGGRGGTWMMVLLLRRWLSKVLASATLSR